MMVFTPYSKVTVELVLWALTVPFKVADWLIDLSPEGGGKGSELIAVGTPEQVMKVKESYTGKYLKAHVQ